MSGWPEWSCLARFHVHAIRPQPAARLFKTILTTVKMMSTQQQPDPRSESVPPHPARQRLLWWVQRATAPLLFLVVGLVLIAALGLAQRIGWISTGGGEASDTSSAGGQVYTCPMHPQIRQPNPGRCPICGMALVEATTGAADLEAMSVKIEPAQRRLSNIQTAGVKRGPLSDSIQTVGSLAIDESRMATIASYIDGRLERLFADYTGVDVAKGDHLAVVFSPELYSAQVEYIQTRRSLTRMSEKTLAAVREAQTKLAASSRQRLVELGMTEKQLGELEQSGEAQSRLTIYSPIGGTVIEKLAQEGKYVKPGQPIYRIADLSTVWLMLELFPEDAARIRFGQRVDAEMQSLPGERLEGRVAFVDRTVDVNKRTVGVRVEFLNEDRRLRPGDYANATIHLPIGQEGEVYDADLAGRWISPMHPQIIRDKAGSCPICGMDLVPTSRYGYSDQPVKQPVSQFVTRSALLMAGNNSVVYVETEPGRFEIRPVTIGPILRDKVIILDGLEDGEQVATAGNFLIDSQMQLAGHPSLIDPSRAIAARRERKTPLRFDEVHVAVIAKEAGSRIEELYQAYFAIQKALAADKKPPPNAAKTLNRLSQQLADDESLSDASRSQLADIAKAGEHLHHMELEKARQTFKPISHAVVTLATQVRGQQGETNFFHFFCPMVKGGGGDWLQADRQLVNPYWGSEMLHCGEQVHEFPAKGHAEKDSPKHRHHSQSVEPAKQPKTEGEGS